VLSFYLNIFKLKILELLSWIYICIATPKLSSKVYLDMLIGMQQPFTLFHSLILNLQASIDELSQRHLLLILQVIYALFGRKDSVYQLVNAIET
jgi:hypothetical protein